MKLVLKKLTLLKLKSSKSTVYTKIQNKHMLTHCTQFLSLLYFVAKKILKNIPIGYEGNSTMFFFRNKLWDI